MGTATLTPPRSPQRRPPPGRRGGWPHRQSTYCLAESGADFGRDLKAKAICMVKVVTDDAEMIGYLIRDDEAMQLRVLHCLGFTKKPWERERRQKWRLDAVCRARITEMRRLD